MSVSCLRSLFENVAERDQTTEAFDAWNAVLPLDSWGPAQQINRVARLCREIAPLPTFARLAVQTEGAGGKKRNPDDVAENRAVFMPANSSAGSVFGDEDLLEILGRIAAKFSARARMPDKNSGMSSVFVRPPPLKPAPSI
jgi:hypothetical protein